METDQNDNKVVDTVPNFSCSTTEPTHEFMCVPVSLGKKIYGYLYLDNRLNSTSFTSLDSYLTRFVAQQIAMGLSNLAIREETGILKERLEDKAAPYEQEPDIVNSSAGVIAVSEIMTRTMAQVKQVAGEYSTVLITGETGVGKGLIAKVIHKASPRRDAPFVHVNLSTIPQELISSELFGHEKGAFTGALERYAGRFERAHGGTIFLDEIGGLPHDIQIKLLGVLQDHCFERLGSGKLITSEFRVIAATNRDLERKIEAGQFREDLYYRLSVFPIHVPPLRERKEDIPHLAHHFLLGLARKMGKKVERISEKGLRNLLLYDWPGNVRELEHYIERAVVSTDKKSRVLWLPDINSFRVRGRADSQLLPLAMIEKEHIEKTLHAVRWKVSGPGGAAEILGLNSKTLFSRMKKLGISKTRIRPPDK